VLICNDSHQQYSTGTESIPVILSDYFYFQLCRLHCDVEITLKKVKFLNDEEYTFLPLAGAFASLFTASFFKDEIH